MDFELTRDEAKELRNLLASNPYLSPSMDALLLRLTDRLRKDK